MAYLTQDAIVEEAVASQVRAPGHGAIVIFAGAVRDEHDGRPVARLEYSAYDEMAEREIDRIVQETTERWPCRVAVQHRLGEVEIGDVAVLVAIGSGHRDAAFRACRFVIDQLKHRVPIWKKETYADGSVAWVDPTATEPAAGSAP